MTSKVVAIRHMLYFTYFIASAPACLSTKGDSIITRGPLRGHKHNHVEWVVVLRPHPPPSLPIVPNISPFSRCAGREGVGVLVCVLLPGKLYV